MTKKAEVEMLVDGQLTWVSRSGKTERVQAVKLGDRLQVALAEDDGQFNFIDGGWTSFGISADKFKVVG